MKIMVYKVMVYFICKNSYNGVLICIYPIMLSFETHTKVKVGVCHLDASPGAF